MHHLSSLPALLVLASCFLSSAIALDARADDSNDIKKVVQHAYVEGIHMNGDPEAMRAGFHSSFVMFIQRDGDIRQFPIADWIANVEKANAKKAAERKTGDDANKPKVEAEIDVLDVVSNTAVVRIRLHKDEKLVFTDFMSLYKFEDGWKIVAKVFHRHS